MTKIRFRRPLAEGPGVPVSPLVVVLIDGRVCGTTQPVLVTVEKQDDGTRKGLFEFAVDKRVSQLSDQLVELVLGSRNDILWTNRDSVLTQLNNLSEVLYPAPESQSSTVIPIVQAANNQDLIIIVGCCFLTITGRFPEMPTLNEALKRLLNNSLSIEQLRTRLAASDDCANFFSTIPEPTDTDESRALVQRIAARWAQDMAISAPHAATLPRKSVATARTAPPSNALFSDMALGIHLSFVDGIRYDDGWNGPALTLKGEFDTGEGVLTIVVWRPGITAGDVKATMSGENAVLRQIEDDAGVVIQIEAADTNAVLLHIETPQPHRPGNSDQRRLGFQLVNVFSSSRSNQRTASVQPRRSRSTTKAATA